jgi:hypothetical protein
LSSVFSVNSNATNESNKMGVWDSNFRGVYHLGSGTALSPNDSTSNANTCTSTPGITTTTGKVATAGNFTRLNSGVMNCGTSSTLAVPAHTVSAWINIYSFDGTKGCAAVLASKSNSILSSGIEWCAGRSGTQRLSFAYNDGGIRGWFDSPGAATLSTNTWYHVAFGFVLSQWCIARRAIDRDGPGSLFRRHVPDRLPT